MISLNTRTGVGAWVVYAAVRSVFAIMQVFPMDWNLRTARLLARVWVWLTPRHRDLAIKNISESLGDELTPAQVQRMAHRCLENWAMFAVEVICLSRLVNSFTWNRYIRLVDFEEVLRLMISGRGVILVTGHYGPFELVGQLIAALGFDIVAVMRPLDNDRLNRFLVESRRMNGLSLLDKKGATGQAERVVTEGSLLGVIGDQDAGRKGIFVDFFGRPASTYKSIGLLAMQTGAPIVIGYGRRLGKVAKYEIGVQRIIHKEEWEGQEDPLRWISEAYTKAIEDFVRVEPSQYLWIHRRWKSRPKSERA